MALSKKDFAKLTFPKIPPEKVVGDYLTSKRQDELIKKYPVWDIPRISPAVELVDAKRELYDSEQRLQSKKSDAAKRLSEMDAEWQDLAEKEELLRQSFIKFNKFVRENQEKRERAEKKTAEEIALQQRRDREIQELQEKYQNMQEVKSSLEENVTIYKMYQEYLQAVAKSSPDFKNINDILNRYETLAEARKKLAERQERDLTALENARSNMIKLTEEKTLAIMGLNNQVADLQVRYESAKSKALQWETMVTQIKNICVDKVSELDAVRLSCKNVYLQMCKRKEIEPEYDEWDIENQLLFIKKTMLELKHITFVAKRRLARDTCSVKIETPHTTK